MPLRWCAQRSMRGERLIDLQTRPRFSLSGLPHSEPGRAQVNAHFNLPVHRLLVAHGVETIPPRDFFENGQLNFTLKSSTSVNFFCPFFCQVDGHKFHHLSIFNFHACSGPTAMDGALRQSRRLRLAARPDQVVRAVLALDHAGIEIVKRSGMWCTSVARLASVPSCNRCGAGSGCGKAASGWLLPLIVRDPMTANTKGSHSTSTQPDALEGAQ